MSRERELIIQLHEMACKMARALDNTLSKGPFTEKERQDHNELYYKVVKYLAKEEVVSAVAVLLEKKNKFSMYIEE